MSHRISTAAWFSFVILTILGGSLASAVTINVDSGSDGNDIITPGESWKFFKGTEPPGNPPEAWTAIDFDDSQWQTGASGFGYGDNDDATVLNDMQGNYVSVYIRKEFSGSSLTPDDVLTLEVDYDDGFIAYLNGVEVARANMPTGAAAYNTTASSAHEAGSPETFVLGTAGELLNPGSNIMAIEGHNTSSSSSDFSLIPALRASSEVIRTGDTWIVETDTVTLKGNAIAPSAASVLVNGTNADFSAGDGVWSIEISLAAGSNSLTIEQLDTNAKVVASRMITIMYIPAANNVTGELTEDTTWAGACVLEDTVTVPSGVVLKIEPGTMVLMKDEARLVVYGQLLAEGTETNPIYFTRESDGVKWKQIMFVEARDSRLVHCVIEYADSEGAHQDYYVPGPRNYHEAIVALACHLDIEDCTFRNLPDESAGAEGDAMAIISDDQDHPGDASANVRGCQFLSIGQGVHTRYAYVLVEDCYFTGKRGDNDDVDLWGESTPEPLIRNNLFLNPEHDDMINPTRCSAIIVGNVIGSSDDHGVVLRDKCSPVMMNNFIFDCSSAGVAVENSCQATLINNTIVDCGRGVRLLDLGRWDPPYSLNPGGGTATIINCIIWDCPQSITLADSPNTQIADRGSHVTVKYSDIQGGQNRISVSGSHSTVTWEQGNINVDPQFAAAGNRDYHLKSGAGRWDPAGESWVLDNITSPCIDAGDPGSPVAFEPYPNGGIINMGVYGGTTEASKSPSGLHGTYGGGTGEPNDPYLIYTDLHINTIGLHEEDFDKHFKLMADIDLGGLGEKDFNMIGNINSPFSGVFDGNGHTISNFHYISTDVNDVALFQYVEGKEAQIRDLGLIDPIIDVNSNEPLNIGDWNNAGAIYGNTAGALVNSLSQDALLSGCYVSGGSVSGDLWVGGLVSYVARSTIENCYSTAKVTGQREIGGLAAYNDKGIITDCHTIAIITAKNRSGGLVGYNLGTIRNCHSTVNVTCCLEAGGLAGYNIGTIDNSYSKGNVTGDQDIGGLAGTSYGDISSCSSTADVSGEDEVGGLVGYSNGNLTNCSSSGSVSGQQSVGGLAGVVGGPVNVTVANCSSDGNVIGIVCVGGLLGNFNVGILSNCYSTSGVSGDQYVGGLAGTIGQYATEANATIINCYSAGNVVGTTGVGGLVGYSYNTAVVRGSFWDIETSGQTTSFAGTGKTTAEMQTAGTFLDDGWDFFDETENGTDDIWWIDEGQDYPRLWWELPN
jgi:hypothetical protein